MEDVEGEGRAGVLEDRGKMGQVEMVVRDMEGGRVGVADKVEQVVEGVKRGKEEEAGEMGVADKARWGITSPAIGTT